MAVGWGTKTRDALIALLADAGAAAPVIRRFGTAARLVEVAALQGYPSQPLTTYVTLGAASLPVSLYRRLKVGHELTLTVGSHDIDWPEVLGKTVLENLRAAERGERRPFIEANGVYAPGYPPHLLFTDQIRPVPLLSGRQRLGDMLISFFAAIPLGDSELRAYDHDVRGLIAMLGSDGRVVSYPRVGT